MASPNMAKRTYGVCRGSLWRHTTDLSKTSSSKSYHRVYEYCVLVGTSLSSYESLQTFEKGAHPVVTIHILGASAISTDTSSFRLMTNQGTHVHCTAPTSSCRDVWLGALNAGLERRLMEPEIPLLPPIKPPMVMRIRKTDHFCHSCGKVERLEFPLYQTCAPLPQYGLEERCDLCPKCATSQAVLDHVTFLGELYASAAQEQQAMLSARTLCLEGIQQSTKVVEGSTGSTIDDVTVSLQQVSLTPQSTQALQDVFDSPAFAAHQRVSPTLDSLCQQFHQGIIGVMEFLESLDHAVGKRDPSLSLLKKQAFRVAGDMGTAMKLLLEHALPPTTASNTHRNHSPDSQNTELLQCILEFLLELIDEGEMNTLAFFWSQLCCIHLRMLPPQDAAALKRVELVEDFLLTVSTRHSIQLAIELIWSHTADLEDSQGLVPTCSRECKRRRVAVIRFICELESLLFDFDSGWGGGTVCVGTVLSPSTHQVKLLANGMQDLQLFRKQAPDRLSRSVRMDKITDKKNSNRQIIPKSPQNMAQEALRIAKNADYFSSHLAFTKRLCDIAEKLRFMPVDQRAKALQTDLGKLNVSGAMGGDPLNKVRDNDNHSRVVRVPWTEGHVFRSKERTPVLLLMEVVDEGAIESHDDDWKQTEGAKGSTAAAASEVVEIAPEIKEIEGSPEKQALSEEAGDSAEVEGEADSPAENGEEAKSPKAEVEEGKPSTESDEEKLSEKSDEKSSKEMDEKSSKETDEKSSEETDEMGDASALGKSQEEMSVPATTTDDDDEEFQSSQISGPATTTDDDDEEFQSARSDDESITEAFHSPTKEGSVNAAVKKAVSIDASIALEGSMHDSSDLTSRHALRRFDSPKNRESPRKMLTPTPAKHEVEALVTNLVAKQLQLPNLATTDEEETSSSDEKETSLANGKTEKNEHVKVQLKRNGSYAREKTKRMSTLGVPAGGDSGEASNPLSKTGDTRREVLNSIMSKGFAGSNTIAAEAATAVRRHLQVLERRRAVELLLTGEDTDKPCIKDPLSAEGLADSSRKELLSLGIRSVSVDHEIDVDNNATRPSEEDEAMEAVRLLLIQYRVAQGELSADAAAKALAPRKSTSLNQINSKGMKSKKKSFDPREIPAIDAGDVDPRLVGCGALPPAVLQALTLWKGGMVTNGELLTVVKKDLEYVRQSAELEESKDKLSEDSAFWGRFAFGERWAEKQSRIGATSPEASQPGWHLMGVIVKSNDDLRQEAFVMQLIELCQEAFQEAELELWLYPYRILSTSRSTGIIEMVRNAMSFDALKKRPGYGSGGLREHLQRMTQYTADPGEAFKTAQRNFVRSTAAYSLLSYFFLFKDRHNGNILLDTAGHVIHIDFGFVFGVAPGGSFSLELSTPFKLTDEMIEVMDGLRSSLFSEFVTLFCCGFLALQAHCDTFLTIVDITCTGSSFKCFEGREPAEVVAKLRERFCPDLGKEETIAFALDLIKQATHSYGTKQYDYFQYLSQGIAA